MKPNVLGEGGVSVGIFDFSWVFEMDINFVYDRAEWVCCHDLIAEIKIPRQIFGEVFLCET